MFIVIYLTRRGCPGKKNVQCRYIEQHFIYLYLFNAFRILILLRMIYSKNRTRSHQPSGPFCGGYLEGRGVYVFAIRHVSCWGIMAFCYGKQQTMINDTLCVDNNFVGYCITVN